MAVLDIIIIAFLTVSISDISGRVASVKKYARKILFRGESLSSWLLFSDSIYVGISSHHTVRPHGTCLRECGIVYR